MAEAASALPDVLRFENGARVTTPADWARRRAEVVAVVLVLEYGRLPPPDAVAGELLHGHHVPRFDGARHEQYRLRALPDGSCSFVLDVLVPTGGTRWPVILTGDGCWRYLTDEITLAVLRRGYVLAQFNRVEIVPDIGDAAARTAALYQRHPAADFGALAAWAWGYHRCVDFLLTCPFTDPERMAIVGHSRGGKTALLAGATDERIALVGANGSGCGGAGSFHVRGEGAETLDDILRRFAYWFTPRLASFAGREDQLPFDQHYLKALIAPRPLVTTEARDDRWANPLGTWHTYAATREVYRLLGAEHRLGICYRSGGHEHAAADWTAFLDFADWHLRGAAQGRRFDAPPFAGADSS